MLRNRINSANTEASNQENATFRQKTLDQNSGAAASRPLTRAALGDLKNQSNQAALKKTGGLKVGKTEESTGITKIEPRRPLRSTTTSNIAQKNDTKLTANSSKNSTLGTSTSASTLLRNTSKNATLNFSMVNAKPKAPAPAVPKTAAVGNTGLFAQKTRLTRSNAVISLHAHATSMNNSSAVGNQSNVTKDENSELANYQAALVLAPVKEENENTSGNQVLDDAYSSAMMPNIDEKDVSDPLLVTDYVNDIYNYLRYLEKKQNIRKNYLEGKDVNGRMRMILIDWLSAVHIRFHLLPETLYMTVALIDRFLQEVKIPKEKLQLLGVTSMFVASKYEEMYAPEISDFSYITDHSCSKQEIRMTECLLLRTLNFNLGRPLPIHFLRRYSKAAGAEQIAHTMAKYFLELSLISHQMSPFAPSITAAVALWLASKLLDSTFEWTPALIYYSKYTETEPEFVACLHQLCRVIVKVHTVEIKQQAIRNKFGTSKFLEISKHPCLKLDVIRKYGGF